MVMKKRKKKTFSNDIVSGSAVLAKTIPSNTDGQRTITNISKKKNKFTTTIVQNIKSHQNGGVRPQMQPKVASAPQEKKKPFFFFIPLLLHPTKHNMTTVNYKSVTSSDVKDYSSYMSGRSQVTNILELPITCHLCPQNQVTETKGTYVDHPCQSIRYVLNPKP